MTLLKIAQIGNPVLLEPAKVVEDTASPFLQQLIDNMIETMEDARGVGLAAPQVYQPLRLFVAKRADLGEAMDKAPPFVIINPKLELVGEESSVAVEGCLSIPGLRGFVERSEQVRYSGLDRYGKVIDGEASGFLPAYCSMSMIIWTASCFPKECIPGRTLPSMPRLAG